VAYFELTVSSITVRRLLAENRSRGLPKTMSKNTCLYKIAKAGLSVHFVGYSSCQRSPTSCLGESRLQLFIRPSSILYIVFRSVASERIVNISLSYLSDQSNKPLQKDE